MLSESVITTSLNIKNNYYNKFNSSNKDSLTIDDLDYYSKVADDVTDVSSITVAGIEMTSDKILPLSIGNNVFIENPMFKEIDGGLYVASVALMTFADESGNIEMTIKYNNGRSSNIIVNTGVQNIPTLTVGEVATAGGKDGYENTASKEVVNGVTTITHNRQYGTSYVTCELLNGTEQLLAADNHVLYTLKTDGERYSLGLTTLESNNVYGYCERYLNFAFADEEGKRPVNNETLINLVIPEVGRVKLNIIVNESIKA